MSQHRRNWGAQRLPTVVLQPVSLALLTLLDDLDHSENQSPFVNLCYIMQVLSTQYRSGNGVLSLVRQTIAERSIAIPAEASRFLAEETSGRRRSRPQSEGSEVNIEHLLGKWKDFNLGQRTVSEQTDPNDGP